MSMAGIGSTDYLSFFAIQDDQITCEGDKDKDIFVGRNAHLTLTIINGQIIQVRDIVVLGKLTLRSSNMNDASARGSLVARDIFSAGEFDMKYAELVGRNLNNYKNVQQLEADLLDRIVEPFRFQREFAEKIGLRSVLM